MKNVPAAISHSQWVVDLHMTSCAMRPKPSEYAASTSEALESDVPMHGQHPLRFVYRTADPSMQDY